MSHVLARVSGFGWTVLPHVPFRFERVDDNERVLRVHRGGATTRQATVYFDATTPRVELSSGTESADQVCDLTPSTTTGDFEVETSVFTVRWPADFDIISTDPGAPSPFDFIKDDGSLVYVQGPLPNARVPKLDAMCAAGQRILKRGTHARGEWIELAYEHEGRAHWQSHTTILWGEGTTLVVTAQSPEEHAVQTKVAAELVCGTLEPRHG